MVFLFQDQNQGIRNDVDPRANARGRRKPFSFIRTVTVGFGIAPNLLTLLLPRKTSRKDKEGARGLGLRHPYRRWGFSPRPENIGRPEWTTCPRIWPNAAAAASTFGMGKRHVPMPPEQGRQIAGETGGGGGPRGRPKSGVEDRDERLDAWRWQYVHESLKAPSYICLSSSSRSSGRYQRDKRDTRR